MSMAIKYRMMKKAKGGKMCGPDCPGCEMCHGGKMAEGGWTEGGAHKPVHGSSTKATHERSSGMSFAGQHVRGANMAKEAGQNKAHASRMQSAKNLHSQNLEEIKESSSQDRKYLADGGDVEDSDDMGDSTEPETKPVHHKLDKSGVASVLNAFGPGEAEASDEVVKKAHGGMMHNYAHNPDLDMVGHIMKKRAHMYSKGGRVANESGPIVDFDDNNFDDLVLRDDLEEHYTGANSGDEIGDAQEDADRRDVVSQIMKSRKKKDRNPSPA